MGRFATSSRRSIARFHCPLQSCRRPDRQAVAVALCLLIALSPTLAKPLLAAAPPEKVLASDRSAVRFSLSDLEPVWTEHVLRGGKLKLHRLRLTGFVNVGEPARPELPQRGGWVLVPPGKRPRVVAIDERWESITPRRLMVAQTPVLVRDPDSEQAIVSSELLLPGEEPRGDAVAAAELGTDLDAGYRALSAGPAVALGAVTPWRGRRIVPYTVTPVRVDAAGNATQVLRGGTWEIRFETDDRSSAGRAGSAAYRKTSSRGDGRFGFMFLNAEQIQRWPTEAAADPTLSATGALDERLVRTGRRGQLLAPEARIPVSRTRLYRVTASGLQGENLLPGTGIQEDQIRLYQRRYLDELAAAGVEPPYLEIEVPIKMMGGGDAFSGDDFFLFYGLRPRDDLSREVDLGEGPLTLPDCGDIHENNSGANIYWLAASEPDAGESWARMAEITLPAAAGAPLPSYRRVDYFEENNSYHIRTEFVQEGPRLVPIDIDEGDRNRWNSRYDTDVRVRVRIYAADPAADNAQVRVGCIGYANSTTSREAEVYLENDAGETLLATTNLNRLLPTVVTVPLLGSQLDYRVVTFRLQREGGTRRLYSYLDWLELSYDALYRARDDTLLFHGGDDLGQRDIEVTGFRSADLGLVEITDPHQPAWVALAPANVLDAGGSFTLSLGVSQDQGRRTFFTDSEMADDGIPEIIYFRASVAPQDGDPTQVSAPPDLIVITHEEFRDAIVPWIDYRRSRSGGELVAHLVDIDDLYDHYSGGLKNPRAIRRFALHAVAEWGSRALQLVGDANENVRQFGDPQSSDDYFNEVIDWVPTRLHVQNIGGSYPPEFLASDKWFATLDPDPDLYPDPEWPDDYGSPSEMYVGRFPCNSVGALQNMIAKVMTFEDVQPGQDWRKRGVFFADDAWSYRYGNVVADSMDYKPTEEAFETSENLMASWWDSLADLGLRTRRFFISNYLDPFLEPGQRIRDTTDFQDYAELYALPALLDTLNAGSLIVHYQGHANKKLLSHEVIFQDEPNNRHDIANLNNTGKPWIFYGMGCHISDWAENPVHGSTIVEPSLGEKLLLRSNRGAVATYASSGYEYLDANARFSELQLQRYILDPPTVEVGGGEIRSRWMLGELCWAAEMDLLNVSFSLARHRRMVAQYALLGDCLLVLNCGPSVVTTRLADAAGDTLSEDYELSALDETNVRQLEIIAADEAGTRLEVTRSDGADLGQYVTEDYPPGHTSQQRVTYHLDLPLRPFEHTVAVKVYDTATIMPTDLHYELTLRISQSAVFYVDGQPVAEGEVPFQSGVPLAMTAEIYSAAWLDPAWELQLSGENLTLSTVQIDRRDEHNLDLAFTATPTDAVKDEQSLVLTIDGSATTYVLGSAAPVAEDITAVQAFPNPMSERTRFLFRTGADVVASGTIRIFSVAGRPVASLPVRPDDFSGGDGLVPWNGRDGQGDLLANGVYLYRVELESPRGRIISDMQRLVVMR